MKALRAAFAIAATLVIALTGTAGAADLYGGGMKDEPYVHQSAGPSGWYVTGYGAWAFYNIDDVSMTDLNNGTGPVRPTTVFTSTGSEADDGWAFGGGVGKYFGRGFRGDLTLEYRGSTDVSGTVSASCCSEIATETEVDGIVGLANLYYYFNRGGRFVPYIGGGIGFAHLETSGGTISCVTPIAPSTCGTGFGDATYGGSSTTNFAVAGMAGVSMKLRGGDTQYTGGMKDEPVAVSSGRAMYLDVGYRFMYLGDIDGITAVQADSNQIEVGWDSLMAHEIRAGLRFDLN